MAGLNVAPLSRLARQYGIQTSYYDVHRRRCQADPAGLLALVRAMGAPVETLADVPDALKAHTQAQRGAPIEPVVVAWEGKSAHVELRLPDYQASGSFACQLRLETGETKRWAGALSQLRSVRHERMGGAGYVTRRIPLPAAMPWGYHRLRIDAGGRRAETLVIGAPTRAYVGGSGHAAWGLFVPLYALHREPSWGAGDYGDLRALNEWVRELGGDVVATLPLLASRWQKPFDPSPYSPSSRLFWNEFYVDVLKVPELQGCPAARTYLNSSGVRNQLAALRKGARVDYPRQMAVKRKLLEEMTESLFARGSSRQAELRRFVAAHPDIEDYARFRATSDRRRAPWPEWPERLRDGTIGDGDYDESVMRYHLYAQWLAQTQLQELAAQAREGGEGLYLDLPLGVHPHGYDVWRHREAFVLNTSGGAPPDAVFTKGQQWGFPPLHPERERAHGYPYVIRYLRHHLQQAGILRIDHVMALHRLYCVPAGLEARQGAYLQYRAEELYAILSLESHRHRSWLVGENLGTVPTYVNAAMRRHRIHRMYVMQYELTPGSRRVLRTVARDEVASLNTHDMPPFAAYWDGRDIRDRVASGLLTKAAARRESRVRRAMRAALIRHLSRAGIACGPKADHRALLHASLAFLGRSRARLVLVNLEDLWMEMKPQNLPGTGHERLNWTNKLRYRLEELRVLRQVVAPLRDMDRLRRRIHVRNRTADARESPRPPLRAYPAKRPLPGKAEIGAFAQGARRRTMND